MSNDFANWPYDHAGYRAPDSYRRIQHKTLQDFALDFASRKKRMHRTAHLRDLYAKCIGFVDFDEPAWVLINVHDARHSTDDGCPEGLTDTQWDVVSKYVKTWAGRDKLFGPHPDGPPPSGWPTLHAGADALHQRQGEVGVEGVEVPADARRDEEGVDVG